MLVTATVAAIVAPMPADLQEAPMPTSQKYDAIFRKHGRGLPVPFLRALAKRESNLNPREANGPAWGLLQVVRVVLNDYNKRHGTNYQRTDLLDPVINTRIATDTISRIIRSYERNHPGVLNMQENWSNPEFVKLLTAGWNSGYSEAGGVGRVADYLERKGIPVTHDNVFEYAAQAGATQHLSNPGRQRWQRSVVDLFYTMAAGRLTSLDGTLSPFLFLFPHVTPAGLSLSGAPQTWKWAIVIGALAGAGMIGYAILRRQDV